MSKAVSSEYLMLRLARLGTLGALHHVIICGIERQNMFKDNSERAIYSEGRRKDRVEARSLFVTGPCGN